MSNIVYLVSVSSSEFNNAGVYHIYSDMLTAVRWCNNYNFEIFQSLDESKRELHRKSDSMPKTLVFSNKADDFTIWTARGLFNTFTIEIREIND